MRHRTMWHKLRKTLTVFAQPNIFIYIKYYNPIIKFLHRYRRKRFCAFVVLYGTDVGTVFLWCAAANDIIILCIIIIIVICSEHQHNNRTNKPPYLSNKRIVLIIYYNMIMNRNRKQTLVVVVHITYYYYYYYLCYTIINDCDQNRILCLAKRRRGLHKNFVTQAVF